MMKRHSAASLLHASALSALLALASLLSAPATLAQAGEASAALLDINDPAGDDSGDGRLRYPRNSAFAAGDLDLRRMRVFAESGGLRIEATFANVVRHPSSARGTGLGAEDLSLFARHGFYAFNLDLYLDTDRVPGSGVMATLPGRGARMHPAHAWEKAIVLTPRPELMRRQLIEALAEVGPGGSRNAAESEIDKAVFFATEVRVRGRTVSFFVPSSFVEPSALVTGSLAALVTGAKLTIESNFNAFTLGAQRPAPGRPAETMGYDGERPATAVVDLLAPDAAQQSAQLALGTALTGVSPRTAVPSSVPAVPSTSAVQRPPSWLALALDVLTGFAPRPQAAALPAAAGTSTPAPVATTPAVTAPAAVAAPAVAAPARARDAAFYEQQELRLRALQRLRDAGLITEEEFQRKRREILEAL